MKEIKRAISGLLLFVFTVCLGSCVAGEEPPAGRQENRGGPIASNLSGSPWSDAVESVTGERVRERIEILAADEMEGREAGTAGYQRAAQYVAREFEAIGLRPLGDGNSYLQSIELFETRLVSGSARARLAKGETALELDFPVDFIRFGGYAETDEEITAPLVFVGHGITAPEYDYDDFAGVDVDGKILVVLSGAPPHFASDLRAFYSSGDVKQARAAELGALGLLSVRTPVDQERRPWARYLPGIGRAEMSWVEESGRVFGGFPELAGNTILSETGAEKLFALSGHDLPAIFERHSTGETGSFEMGVSATLARSSKQRAASSANVVGLLEGSDPTLRGEHLVYTAHLDHLGIREGDDGDEIHHGAYDNAAGVAAILEIARAMSSLAVAPRRSIIFAALAAEEKGLRGSSYLARNLPVPLETLVANLNIDMPYLGFPIADVEAFGVEHSSLQLAVHWATEALGLALSPDSMPEQVRFVRSDQFSFVQMGVPALALKPGSSSSDPSIDGAAMLADFLKNHYHRASDDLDLAYSPEGAQRFVRAALLTGLFVAGDDDRPRWNEGDFFGEKFAR